MGKIQIDPEKGNPCMPHLKSLYLIVLQMLFFFLLLHVFCPQPLLSSAVPWGWQCDVWMPEKKSENLPHSRDWLKAGKNSLSFSFGRWEKINERTSVTKTPLIACTVIRCFKNPGIHLDLCTLEAFPTQMPALLFLPWSRGVAAWVVLIWFSLHPWACGILTQVDWMLGARSHETSVFIILLHVDYWWEPSAICTTLHICMATETQILANTDIKKTCYE